MHGNQLRKGIKITIKDDISRTTHVLSSDIRMKHMSGNGKVYEIKEVRSYTNQELNITSKIASVGGHVWMPEDLIRYEASLPDGEHITLTGNEELFDPSEL